jgi:hypothetical protein
MEKITITKLDGTTEVVSLEGYSDRDKYATIRIFENRLACGDFIMMQVS